MINGYIVAYFSSALGPFDVKFFKLALGDAAGQQVWETMAVLQALRLWRAHWRHVRARLSVKTDNYTALAAVAYLKSKTGTMVARLARELALELSGWVFGPDFAAHLPGVAKTLADALSRKTQPGKVFTLPAALRTATEAAGPPRDLGFFRSLRPPK